MSRRRAVSRAAIRSLPLVLFVLAGCGHDLAVRDVTANASSPDVIEFSYTLENLEVKSDSGFESTGPVRGPINVQVYTSADGESLDAPAAAFFTPVLPTEVLEPGDVVHAEGVASADIDLTERPYLILVVDPRNQRPDRDPLNNVYSVRVAHGPAPRPTEPAPVIAPIQPVKKPLGDVQMYPFTADDTIAPEAPALEKFEQKIMEETGGVDASQSTILEEDTGPGTGGGADTGADTDTGTP